MLPELAAVDIDNRNLVFETPHDQVASELREQLAGDGATRVD